MDTKPFTYCFIRKDLPKAQQIIQMSHACYGMGTRENGMDFDPNICLFEVNDEKELRKVADYIESNHIDYVMFIEPDFGDEATALATEILYSKESRALFENFRLYR